MTSTDSETGTHTEAALFTKTDAEREGKMFSIFSTYQVPILGDSRKISITVRTIFQNFVLKSKILRRGTMDRSANTKVIRHKFCETLLLQRF